MQQFTSENFLALCDGLAAKDKDLQGIISEYGYPPFWTRPNTFQTLVLTILEQQVSLASAYAAFTKLKTRLPRLTPKNFLTLTDEELRGCYFSRQKIVYTRGLAEAILSKQLNLKSFEEKEDETVRQELIALKGIGAWTVDVYLLHTLQRTDVFPIGDIALLNAVRMIKNEPLTVPEILRLSHQWKPYRSIATLIFWHHYIKKKNIKLLH